MKVGDLVTIVKPESCYTSYEKWFDIYNLEDLKQYYVLGRLPIEGVKAIIKAVFPLSDCGKKFPTYAVQTLKDGTVFLFEERGIEINHLDKCSSVKGLICSKSRDEIIDYLKNTEGSIRLLAKEENSECLRSQVTILRIILSDLGIPTLPRLEQEK